MQLLRQFLPLAELDSVLDVGGQVDASGVQLLETYARKDNLTVVNVRQQHLDAISRQYPEVRVLLGDACRLDFPDKSFDLVYSNAVIEHVGGWTDQQAMAREVMRVGRSWFITTPNRWFPFEFHTRLPFVSWLPAGGMRRVARLCAYSHTARRYRSGIETRIRLLTGRELRKLFPGSRVIPVRITAWPETFVVVGGEALER
jgi:ubiquinone/menaquinone biosynthesis C-methylase UbiE